MSFATKDLTGIRQQIMDNAEVAFRLLNTGAAGETDFKIITIRYADEEPMFQYVARVVYGRDHKLFIEGESARDVHYAYETLLEASSEVLGHLIGGKLDHAMLDAPYASLECGGVYNTAPTNTFS